MEHEPHVWASSVRPSKHWELRLEHQQASTVDDLDHFVFAARLQECCHAIVRAIHDVDRVALAPVCPLGEDQLIRNGWLAVMDHLSQG